MEEQDRYLTVLSGSAIFRGFDRAAIGRALEEMDARYVDYDRGATIYRPHDAVKASGIVLEGEVIVQDMDDDGGSVSITRLRPGDEFGAFMVLSEYGVSPMWLHAAARTRVLFIDIQRYLRSQSRDADHWRMRDNLVDHFAGKCVMLYRQARIFGRRRIRARVRIYLMSLPRTGDEVTLPVNRTELAASLGVDRAALARELARMRDEGLIAVNRRRVCLLDKDFFRL